MSDASQTLRRGAICTFYSYKGGVGRSMTLANVATLMARWNKRVLIVDWDLEAPGLERFFTRYIDGSRKRKLGLVDLFEARQRGEPISWRDCLLTASPGTADAIDILHAGLDDDRYVGRMRSIRWDGPADDGLGDYLEALRSEWKREYDFILIDSRTGITDVGGICAVHLPDVLVALFTTTYQSLDGVVDILTRTQAAREAMRVNRTKLLMLPIPARDESGTEYVLANEWRTRFSAALGPFMADWLPKGVTADAAFSILRVPYVAFWSFGETLPVLSEDPDNPKTLAYSFTLIARLLTSRMDWSELRTGAQALEASVEQQARLDVHSAEAARKREEALLLAEERERQRAKVKLARYEQVRAAISDRLLVLRQSLLAQSQKAMILSAGSAAVTIAGVLATLAYAVVPKFHAAANVMVLGEPGGVSGKEVFAVNNPVLPTLFVVTTLSAMALAFGWIRQHNHRRRLAELDGELAALRGQIRPYRGLSESDSWALFAERIERIAAPRSHDASRGPDEPAASLVAAPPEMPQLPAPAPMAAEIQTRVVTAPKEAELPPVIDVLLAYAAGGIAGAWMREFLPLLTIWLGEALGRDPVIHDARADAGEQERMFGGARGHQALERASSAVVIVNRRLLGGTDGLQDVSDLIERLGGDGRSFLISLDREQVSSREMMTPGIPVADFSSFAFVGEGFSKSDRYVAFQQAVKAIASEIATAIQRPPA